MKRNIFAMLFVFAIGLDGLAIENGQRASKEGRKRVRSENPTKEKSLVP
jgi:hypothetical protein